jgi:uncharacterized RDD family membrane protein YckC
MVKPQPTEVENPFAPPKAPVARKKSGGTALAPRRLRLVAAVLDGLTWAPIGLFYALAESADEESLERFGWYVGVGVYAVALVAWNALWLHRFGQSIGKRMQRIAIVRSDGSRAHFGRIVALRITPFLVMDSIGQLATVVERLDAAWLAQLAGIVWLADTLFIFGPRNRCLHDWLADTIVVETRELPRRRRSR